MSQLDWNREGRIWPHRDASAFVASGRGRWHIQRMGEGPPLLLIHGTGASVHSWRGVMPLLAKAHAVTAIDLPRHAFTTGHDAFAMSLPAMTREVAGLTGRMPRPKGWRGCCRQRRGG
ncbi:MAG: alpha/beta fold hydrolase [Tabrizicola sp.]